MLVVAFGVIGLYGLLSGFGTNLGLAYLNFHLPLINRIREAGRHLVLFVIGVSFLSGVGYSLLARRLEEYKERPNPRSLIPAAALLLIFLGIILWELLQNGEDRVQTGFWILALAPILFALGSVWKLSGYKNVTLAAVLVSAAAVVIPVRGFAVSESGFSVPMNLVSHRVIQSFADKIDTAGYRVDFRDAAFSPRLWAMNASYYGVKSFYNQLTPQPYDQFLFSNFVNIPHLRAMMGARYVLCGPTDSPTEWDAQEILETEGYRLYENSKPMARITLVHRVAGSTEDERQFINIITKGFDYFTKAYVTPADFDAAQKFLHGSRSSLHRSDHIKKIVDQANRSYSVVESDSASLLILNEWFTPAWKVQVNWKETARSACKRVANWCAFGGRQKSCRIRVSSTLFQALMALHRSDSCCCSFL